MSSLLNLKPKQFRRAANILEKIQALSKDLESLFGISGASRDQRPRGRRKLTAAARARIAAAARARWARIKGTRSRSRKPRRRMSAAARARIAAAARARWKKAKAQGRTTL